MSENADTAPELIETPMPEQEEEKAEVKILSDDEISAQIKPLSKNGFARAFQKLGRWYITGWHGFADKHPKLSKAIYTVGFFFAFSMAVTVLQMILFIFMPSWFSALNNGSWGWPIWNIGELKYAKNVATEAFGIAPGTPLQYMILGDEGGLGTFIAAELTVFIAQCINFPLQRNITFRSHGNPWYQAMWYFIGWVLISVFLSAVWNIINPFIIYWGWNPGLIGLAKTFITGGVSMIIFFPIFMIIFPDYNKVAKRLKKKVEKLRASGKNAEKLAKLETKLEDAELKAKLSNTEKDARKTATQASTGAMTYFKTKENIEKAQTEVAALEAAEQLNAKKIAKTQKELAELEEALPKRLERVSMAVVKKTEANSLFLAAKAEKEEYDAKKAEAKATAA